MERRIIGCKQETVSYVERCEGDESAKANRMNWNSRGDRLARMKERDEFAKYFMPIAYLVGGIGLVLVIFSLFDPFGSQRLDRQILGVGLCLVGLPIVLLFYRIARGHFSSRLRD